MNSSLFFRRVRSVGLFGLLTAFLSTCSPNSEPQPADAVKNFYEKLFQIVEQNSINRRKIDWTDYKTKVWATVGSAKTVPETEAAMVLAMALLKDNHSSILVSKNRFLFGGIGCQAPPAQTPPVQMLNVGYVDVPGFADPNQGWTGFAQAVQTQIIRQDKPDLKGWIVDLRRNTGGYEYPMIAGVGPLIGDGICLFYDDIDNIPVDTLRYQNGAFLLNQRKMLLLDNPYQLTTKNLKIAVLIGGATASAGEATAIAFVGLPNTRLFGSSTCGTTTGSTIYDLPFYGYQLNLFTRTMAGRTGTVYGQEIKPDEVASDNQVFDKATKWILQ